MIDEVCRELAREIEKKTAKQLGQTATVIQPLLGTIMPAGLKLDAFKREIRDYLVADWTVTLRVPAHSKVGTTTSPVDDNGVPLPDSVTSSLTRFDYREVTIPNVHVNFKAGLKSGDRVLVMPVNRGQEFVVVAKVVRV